MKLLELQSLVEGRDAPLYHGTTKYNIARIIASNTLRGKNLNPGAKDHYVSFTRNAKAAEIFLTNVYEEVSPFVLEIDQRRLSHDYKIQPHNFHSLNPDTGKPDPLGISRYSAKHYVDLNEYEERVKGDIKNLSKYLTAIRVSLMDFDLARDEIDDADIFEAIDKHVLSHPLLYDTDTKRFVNR